MNQKGSPGVFYGYVIVFACFLFQGVGIGSYIGFGVFFKPLIAEFGWSRATVSGAASMAFLLMGALGMLVGTLNDRFGPRILMLVTGVFYGSGYFLLSRVHSVWELYIFYGLVVGIGLSSIDVIALTTTARWFVRRRGTMTGFVKVGTGAGQLVMPLTASLLILHYGWRNASVGVGLIALILIVCSGLFLRRDPAQMGLFPDGDGGPENAQTGKTGESLSAGEALRTPQFYAVCLMNFLVVGCLMTVMVHIVPHAQDSGLDPMNAAGVLSTIGGVSMAGRLLSGLALDKFGNKTTILVCFGLLLVSLLWLRTAGEWWMLYLFAAIYGVAHGGFFTLISPVVAGLFGVGSHGLLIGIVVFTGTVGGAFGPVLAGYIFDRVQSYQPVFLLLIGAALAGLALTPFLKPAGQGPPARPGPPPDDSLSE
jgi:MFS family permease